MSWDAYAPFYDWENARTMGRRDLQVWKRFLDKRGRVLELGCGTGRVLMPLARAGGRVVGIDASSEMLSRAHNRVSRLPRSRRPRLVLGDIRALPFSAGAFKQVIAPYGVLQSLTNDADFDATIAECARVIAPGGSFGLELIPELASWKTYQRQTRFRGRLRGRQVTLVESVRQDRRRGLTIFDEDFAVRRRDGQTRHHRFSLTFRTTSMDPVLASLTRAGFRVEQVAGDYRGGVWTPDSDVWIVAAIRP